MLEGTKESIYLDMTFDLTTSWFAFSNFERRSAYPLLSAASWHAVLSEEVFTDAAVIDGSLPSNVILCRTPQASQTGIVEEPTESACDMWTLVTSDGMRDFTSELMTALKVEEKQYFDFLLKREKREIQFNDPDIQNQNSLELDTF